MIGGEVELTVQARQVLVGDYVHVGHHWWGLVKRKTSSSGLVMLDVGGMAYLIAVPEEYPNVEVRRTHIDGSGAS